MKHTLLPLLVAPALAHAATTIDSTDAHAYGSNIGWVNARGDVTNGAVIGEFFCSGYLYSANCGWIHLGNGSPTNGSRYSNTTAADCGVNTQDYFIGPFNATPHEVKLRGLAYGANIGWVVFENGGDPRVDLTTGQLKGHAWGANVGWIVLNGTGVSLFTDSIAPGADTDADAIPDAWEYFRASGLGTMSLTTDSDGDGVLDRYEYVADTNPFDVHDRLQITSYIPARELFAGSGIFVADLLWAGAKTTRRYDIERSVDLLAPFTVTVSNVAGGFRQFNDTVAVKKFYRIRPKLPLAP